MKGKEEQVGPQGHWKITIAHSGFLETGVSFPEDSVCIVHFYISLYLNILIAGSKWEVTCVL